MPRPQDAKPAIDRFRASIVVTYPGCWEWQKAKDKDGYGLFKIGSRVEGTRRMVKAHRWAYEYFKAKIPTGLQIDHICSNKCCVNPDHLDAVTILENTQRFWQRGGTRNCLGFTGRRHTDESKLKMRKARLGKPRNMSTKDWLAAGG